MYLSFYKILGTGTPVYLSLDKILASSEEIFKIIRICFDSEQKLSKIPSF